jgi:hypothetical protein
VPRLVDNKLVSGLDRHSRVAEMLLNGKGLQIRVVVGRESNLPCSIS